MLKSNYGLQNATSVPEAREMLEGINDVLTWFCLNHSSARFCRTLVLSGFTINQLEYNTNNVIIEANTRFSAMLTLGQYGMLGDYQPTGENNETLALFGTDCANTFLLMQTHEESLAEVQLLKDGSNSHACQQISGCWKRMSLRTAIIDLYGEYSLKSKSNFVSIWKESMSPLLSPPHQPLLTQSSCIKSMPKIFAKAKALFDERMDFSNIEEVSKKAGQA